jgi:hypothetical protein
MSRLFVLLLSAAALAAAHDTSAGSCYSMTTHIISCDVAEAACL